MSSWQNFARRTKNKFGARKTVCLAKKHPHPSALEATVCDLLSAREQKKEICDLKWIATVQLTKSIKWKVDFSYTVSATGEKEWAEAKGKETADFRIKRDLWIEGFGPGKLHLWKGTWSRPLMIKTYVPRPMSGALCGANFDDLKKNDPMSQASGKPKRRTPNEKP